MTTPTGADAMKEAASTLNAACGVHGPIPCEGATCICRTPVEAQPAAVCPECQGEGHALGVGDRVPTRCDACNGDGQPAAVAGEAASTLNAACGVHGPIPCEGATCICRAPAAPLVGEPPFARGSWQHALDDQLVGFGKTGEEFASPHEAVAWLVKQVGECAVSLSASPAAPAGVPTQPDMLAVCAALGFDPTNHHNAAKCPYCHPPACDSSEASGSAIPARPTLPGEGAK